MIMEMIMSETTTEAHVDEYQSQGQSPGRALLCARCGQERWPVAVVEPYTCQRCREVLAGGNAVDPTSDKQGRQTDEQKAVTAALRSRAGRYRVTVDAEGWPMIEGRRARIEYHDARALAVYFEAGRLQAMVARYVKAGCRRHQTGNTEARLLFAPVLLPTIARMIYAKTRRSGGGRSREEMARVRALSPIGRERPERVRALDAAQISGAA